MKTVTKNRKTVANSEQVAEAVCLRVGHRMTTVYVPPVLTGGNDPKPSSADRYCSNCCLTWGEIRGDGPSKNR